MLKISIAFSFLIICIVPTNLLATSFVEINAHEEIIELKQAISLGFVPELIDDDKILEKYKNDLMEFRIEKPEQVGECVVWFATIQLFENQKSVTEYKMGSYRRNNKWYFSSRINPKVIDRVTVNIWCKDDIDVNHSHNHNQIYIFSVDLDAM